MNLLRKSFKLSVLLYSYCKFFFTFFKKHVIKLYTINITFNLKFLYYSQIFSIDPWMKAIADSIVSPQSILPPEKIMLTYLLDILVEYLRDYVLFFVYNMHRFYCRCKVSLGFRTFRILWRYFNPMRSRFRS